MVLLRGRKPNFIIQLKVTRYSCFALPLRAFPQDRNNKARYRYRINSKLNQKNSRKIHTRTWKRVMYNIFSVRTCIFGAIDGAVIFVRRPAAKTHFIVRMRINGIIVDDNKSAVRIRARPLPIHTKIRYNMFFLNIFFGVDPIFV